MAIKLFDSELKVMEILWSEGDTTAKALADRLNTQVGWSKTTTYTVIKKCMEKGAIQRFDPYFVCRAAISRAQAQQTETRELIDKLYSGSEDLLIASLLSGKGLSTDDVDRLRRMVNEMGGGA